MLDEQNGFKQIFFFEFCPRGFEFFTIAAPWHEIRVEFEHLLVVVTVCCLTWFEVT